MFRADGCRTADIASVLRVPGTLNFKYDPPRPVTLTHASAELISTAAMLEAIDAAHCRLCGTAEPASPVHRDDVTLTAVEDTAAGLASDSSFVARLESALATLDPDCEEPEWAMRRLAPLAEAAREHPELDDELYSLARAWSSGELHGSPSEKWRHPGANGRTGEEALDEKWHRFLRSNYRGIPATVGTIFSDATKAGWVDPEDRFEVIDGDVEECA